MRISKIKPNDIVNGEGIMVSLWTQGCPHHCKGCFNKETWDFNGGREFSDEDLQNIIKMLDENGVSRNLAILGGEPLCKENIHGVMSLCNSIKSIRPKTKIYLWTGYTIEDLAKTYNIESVLEGIDVIIDGKFEEDKKDIKLKLRGSSNQRVIRLQK